MLLVLICLLIITAVLGFRNLQNLCFLIGQAVHLEIISVVVVVVCFVVEKIIVR